MKTIYYLILLLSVVLLSGCGGGGDGGTPPAEPTISITDASIDEGNGGTTNLVFSVSLSAAASGDVTFDYTTADSTATAGSDYATSSDTATISAGNTATTISVVVTGDTEVEADETLTITLSNVSGATLATNTATGTIINDDIAIPTSGGPYMMYRDDTNLYAVDANKPSLTYHIDTMTLGSDTSEMVITGDLDINAGTFDNFRPDTFVYFSAGKFWRVDLTQNSNLTPIQVSSANVDYLCNMEVLDNTIAPAHSYIVYVAAASQLDCPFSSQAYIIRLDQDSSVTPKSIDGAPNLSVEALETGINPGEVTGYLVADFTAKTVKKFDADFANPVTILSGTNNVYSQASGGSWAPQNTNFYIVDDIVYSFAHDATSATAMHTITSGKSFDYSLSGGNFECTPTDCYFFEIDGSNIQSMYIAPINGSGSSQLGSDFTTEKVLEFELTAGKLYYRTAPNAGGELLFSMTLPDVPPVEIDSLSGSDYFARMFGINDILYYNSVDAASDSITAKVKKDDGSVPLAPVANALWAGFVFAGVTVDSPFMPKELVLAEEVASPVAGVKYTSYDTSTVSATNVLGTIEGSIVGKTFGTNAWGGTYANAFGTILMGGAMFDIVPNPLFDVFIASTTTAGSLQNVTNTPDVSEHPLF